MISLDQKQIKIGIIVAICVIAVIGYYFYRTLQSGDEIQISQENEILPKEEVIDSEQEEQVIIHIAGQVKNPGIVKIKQGARIADIIEQAGGLAEEADITDINLAYEVEDGQKITIPKKGEHIVETITEESGQISSSLQQTVPDTKASNKKVNINKATVEELQNLDGIGEATAQKIIDYRKANGGFKQIEDLKNVSGIGEAKFEAIKEQITIK